MDKCAIFFEKFRFELTDGRVIDCLSTRYLALRAAEKQWGGIKAVYQYTGTDFIKISN